MDRKSAQLEIKLILRTPTARRPYHLTEFRKDLRVWAAVGRVGDAAAPTASS
jgi:hypothetical protein